MPKPARPEACTGIALNRRLAAVSGPLSPHPSPHPMPNRSRIRCTRCNDSGRALKPGGKPGLAETEPCICAKGRALAEAQDDA